MESIVDNINRTSKTSKLFYWGKLVTITGSAQIIIQAIGLISGILIIRLLSTSEYAVYTLANMMLGTITLLSDGGISSGVMAQGGQVWTDKQMLGGVLASGLNLRRKVGLITILIALPILFYLLIHNGQSILMSFLVISSLVPALLAALSDSLLEIIPKLHQDVKAIQKNQLSVTVIRFMITVISLYVFPFAFISIFAAGVARIYGNLKLRKIVYSYAQKDATSNKTVEIAILKVVKRVLPGSLYYSFSSQMTTWLISIIGHTESVAQIGALGRLSMVLNIFVMIFGTLVVPRFARLPKDSNLLFKRYSQIKLSAICLFAIVILFTSIFSHNILWILGKGYYNLEYELILNMVGSCIGILSGISFSLYSSRGWAIKPIVLIPLDLSVVIIGLFLFNVTTVRGVLTYNIFTSIGLLIINAFFTLIKIKSIGSNKR